VKDGDFFPNKIAWPGLTDLLTVISTVDKHQEGELLAELSLASHHFYHDDRDEHDVEVESGVAAGLAATLRVCVSNRHPRKGRQTKISNVQGLHVAVLVSSLATVLQCSNEVLANHVQNFQSDIILSSEKITDIFSAWKGDQTIQQVALSSITKTLRYIGPHVKGDVPERLMDVLLKIVKIHSVSPDIRADAAAAVCNLGIHQNIKAVSVLEKNASILISTLSTASLPLEATDHNTLIAHLYELAAVSQVFQVKMIKRRCTILAVASSLQQPTDDIQDLALEFYQAVFSNPECMEYLSAGQGDNLDILVKHLIAYTRDERNERRQVVGVSLLSQILATEDASPEGLMDTMRCLAYGGESDDVIRHSAVAYCDGIRKEVEPDLEQLWTLVDFTTFPFAKVRAEALAAIEWATLKSDSVKALLNQTDMVENFSLIVRHGSNEDCTSALDIMRKLARSSLYHSELCSHVGFLREVIDFVTRDHISNRSAHFYAVEMVLALLSNDENTSAFVPFRSLLPWLVSFVNTTTADDDFKKPVVSVIVRLSQAYLDGM
jgi:hypothetical protein